jgi:hypothetical protein
MPIEQLEAKPTVKNLYRAKNYGTVLFRHKLLKLLKKRWSTRLDLNQRLDALKQGGKLNKKGGNL